MNASESNAASTCDAGALNTLVLSELSAVATYDEALRKLVDQHVLADLQTIRAEHERAATILRDAMSGPGGEAPECTGPWSAFAAVAAGMERGLGPATALSALRQGEEHAINEYQRALAHEDVNAGCKEIIRNELLPRSRRHVDELNRLMGGLR